MFYTHQKEETMESTKQARTINTAFAEIYQMDPGTAITKNAIRQAVINGGIPSRKVGRTYLITIQDVLEYFVGGRTNE